MIYLAQNSSEDHKILVRDMFQEIKVSESYLAKLLQTLSKHGMVSSSKGRGGGFYLNPDNLQHSLMDVVRVIDGNEGIEACILGISECSETNPCVVHHLLGPGKKAFNAALSQTTLAQLARDTGSSDFRFPE